MIFKPELRVAIPTKDVLSYTFDNPRYDQNLPVFVDTNDPNRSISFKQAHRTVRQLIAGFRAKGLEKGDCVSIHSFNDIYYPILVLGIIGAGGVYTGTNPAYTSFELQHHLKTAKTRFIISEPEVLGPVLVAIREANIPPGNIWIFDVLGQQLPPGIPSWKELLTHGEEDWLRFDNLKTAQETTAARLFSSGTTGLPKAVVISHRNLVAEHELVFEVNQRPYRTTRVVAIPLFHAASVPSVTVSTLKRGHAVYMMRRFSLGQFLESTERFNCTDLTLVPPIALAIITSPLSKKRPYLKRTKSAISGAAPLSKDVQAKLRSLLGEEAPFTQLWGMTETCCVAIMFKYPEHDDTEYSLIPPRLIDDHGNNISAYGVPGELCIRGPIVTTGYFENPAANAQAFDSDGWFKTGDICYCDETTHKWYIVDRKKELIKVRGFQVSPSELEAVLLSHPQIIDTAVIGIKFPGSREELPRAYVVRKPGNDGRNLTEDEVKQFLLGRLAKYKALEGGVQFIDAIPKNASGKILKRVLQEQANEDIESGAIKPKL
ncbi:hypothetical protein Egran_06746 [Elaphomyces granulatus]|uniref:AMP-dependent synthetase/ligase domain-containing protein n=1 Tax=Elaphomyces granulatus TaxID=519963 RepID=A0A232LMV9_9EURO|nr:hypothetical protein Egran_06746 [Elaphomyces granulatus]